MALFLGAFGIHRFYLGQKGLGIAYIAMFFFLYRVTILIGIIDFIVLLAMDQDEFDHKYNKKSYASMYGQGKESDQLAERKRYFEAKRAARRFRRQKRTTKRKSRWRSSSGRKIRTLRKAGEKAFENFDLEQAIEQFEQVIKLKPKDQRAHFRLACSYSLIEKPERAFFHLDRAVRLGWNDRDRLENEDALAYIRIQPLWETFVKNGYRLPSEQEKEEEQKKLEPEGESLLDQLKQLADQRDSGEISEEEFKIQKEELFDRK